MNMHSEAVSMNIRRKEMHGYLGVEIFKCSNILGDSIFILVPLGSLNNFKSRDCSQAGNYTKNANVLAGLFKSGVS